MLLRVITARAKSRRAEALPALRENLLCKQLVNKGVDLKTLTVTKPIIARTMPHRAEALPRCKKTTPPKTLI